jgi:biopolymer transport protein ExbB
LNFGRPGAGLGVEILASATSLSFAEAELAQMPSPVARFVAAAAEEAERPDGLDPEGVNDRASILLSRIEAQAARTITRGTGILATIGALRGLFGTVWGIMDSFIDISRTNTTNLASRASAIPGATTATAMGLVAAIPAVDAFARAIASYRANLSDAATEVLRHLSRDLDRAACQQTEDSLIVPKRHSAE